MGECSTFIKFLRVVGTAASDKTNVLLSSMSLIAAMLIGSWCLLVMGVLIYTGFIGWRLRSPSAWRAAQSLAEQQVLRQLPEPAEVSDPLLRGTVINLRTSVNEVTQVFKGSPAELRRRMSFVPAALAELEGCAAVLIRRLAGTADYLRLARSDALEEDIRRLTDALQRDKNDGSDGDRLHDQNVALALRKRQLESLHDIQQASDRAEARLSRVMATIEGMPARMIRLRVLSEEYREDCCNDVEGTLALADHELLNLEEALPSAGEAREVRFDTLDVSPLLSLPSRPMLPPSA